MRFHRGAIVFIAAIALLLGSAGALAAQAPAGATAKCADSTYTTVKTKQGACSTHKGVALWYGAGDSTVATPAPPVPAAPAQSAAPTGSTARCKDGSYSTAKTRSGACSEHGGVATWWGGVAAAPVAAASPAGAPQDATALCSDGTYSKSQHRSGTCSDHGGVKQWLKQVPE